MLCSYRCGQEAKFTLKNRKPCCSERNNLCKGFLSSIRKNKKNTKPIYFENSTEICSYGCNQIAKFQFKNDRWCCSNDTHKCPSEKKQNSKRLKKFHQNNPNFLSGQNNPMYGRHLTEEEKNIKRLQTTGKKFGPCSEERKRKISLKRKNRKNTTEHKESLRKWMLGGHAAFMCSCISNDSKPENELFILTCKLLPRPIHKYPIYRGKGKRNYTVDIGDSSLGILLEFDGWYHFNTKEAIERHKKRQQEIEEDGWKFLRYNIFQPFPTLEQVKEDIQKIVRKENY